MEEVGFKLNPTKQAGFRSLEKRDHPRGGREVKTKYEGQVTRTANTFGRSRVCLNDGGATDWF